MTWIVQVSGGWGSIVHHYPHVEVTNSITCMIKRFSHIPPYPPQFSAHAQVADNAQKLHACRYKHAHLHIYMSESPRPTI